MPDLVHTHPTETVRDAIAILREYDVSQMPVVKAEPPVMAGEVAGSVNERDLLDAVFTGGPRSPTGSSSTWRAPLPLVGVGRAGARRLGRRSQTADAVMVVDDGKPVGVLTRHDLLGFVAR